MARRSVRKGAVAIAVATAPVLAMAMPASAETLAPSGCRVWTHEQHGVDDTSEIAWGKNCNLGSSYQTAANMITGLQRILNSRGYGPDSGYGTLTVDGLWGANTQGVVTWWQDNVVQLTPDGVVGMNSWKALRDEIFLACAGCGPNEGFTYSGGMDEDILDNGDKYWYTRNKANTAYVHFDVNGPA